MVNINGIWKATENILGEPLALTEEGKSLTPKYMEKESERFRQIIQDMKEKVK